MKNLFFALRPKHWIKNLFIFIPLIFGEKLFVFPLNLKVAYAFVLFSAMSSAVYLVNDICDVEKDRNHRTKRLRPIASGKVSVWQAWMTVFILTFIVLILSFRLEGKLGVLLLSYFMLNLFYTRTLKDVVIIDVFCIAIFFLMRILAGTVITGVALSHWMVFMVVLLAMFIGFNKRRQEILTARENAHAQRSVLAKYDRYFIDQMIAVLTSSIVVVYMLYTVDARTIGIFGSNHLIYSIPFVYYGIFRYLYLVHKRRRGEDPTVLILSDRILAIDVGLWVLACIAIIYFKI